MRSMVEGAGAPPIPAFKHDIALCGGYLPGIAQAAAPSTAFGGPPPP
jgi:hypothetical protein